MKYGYVRGLHRSRASGRSRRRLRENATPAERALLAALQEANEPTKFQHCIYTAEAPTGYYVVDFYLPKRQLLVELDGKPHTSERAQWNDRLRTAAIKAACPDLRLVRFWNRQVINDPRAIVRELTA